MLYKPKMKCFWHCLYKVAGGPALRLLSGPRGTGENNYDTSLANINFAIPSQSTLQRISKSSHNSMPPSIFNPVLETISASVQDSPKEFILSFDGKSVGTGLKGDCEGDINLWNFESKPNLQEEKDRLSDEQDFVNEIRRSVKEHNLSGIKDNLYKLIKIVTFRIKDIREVISNCKKTEIKYQKADAENPKYKLKHKYTIQHAQYLADNCRSIIQRCLNINKELCKKCSEINRSSHFFNNTSHVDISKQGNMRLLLPPDQIRDFFEDCDNTIYVKQ